MRYIIFFAFFLIIFSCAGDPSKIVIAKFDSGVVSLKEAKDEYNKISDQDKSKYKSDEDYFRLVRKIALEKIMIQAAYKSGVAEEEEFVKRFEETKKNIAYNILKKKNVLDKITVTEADYEKYKKSYELYQIVKRTDILDENKILKAKKSLEKLSKELKDLKSFQEAARIYSEDITASEGGFVGNLRLGVMEEDIDKVMENLGTGRCSKVIETGVGAHLIFINKIDSIPFGDLLQDKKLHEAIYNAKVENIENKWYDNLLKSSELKIDEIKLKKRKSDPEVVVSYKDKKITGEEIVKTVENLRQGTFPEPTDEELLNLVKNMGLQLILEDMMASDEVVNSKDYKESVENEKIFLMKNDFINKNIQVEEISDKESSDFYEENKTTLFTFKDDKNRTYVQPLKEVEKFIAQKLENKKIQDARYNLYRKLIEAENFKVDNKMLEVFRKALNEK